MKLATTRLAFVLLLTTAVLIQSAAPVVAQTRRPRPTPSAPPRMGPVGHVGPPAPPSAAEDMTKNPSGDVFRFGARTVKIPAPDGFEEATARAPEFRTVALKIISNPKIELLAVHLPTDWLNELERGVKPDGEFYTMTGTLKEVKQLNFTEQDFAKMTSFADKNREQILDVNSPLMRDRLGKLRGNLAAATNGEVQLGAVQVEQLGLLEKTADVYSMMTLNKYTTKEQGKQVVSPMLCALSFLRVSNRMVFVYAYRTFKTDDDVKVLQNLSKSWTSKIIVANRS